LSWTNDPNDWELEKLTPVLEALSEVDDVRQFISQIVVRNQIIPDKCALLFRKSQVGDDKGTNDIDELFKGMGDWFKRVFTSKKEDELEEGEWEEEEEKKEEWSEGEEEKKQEDSPFQPASDAQSVASDDSVETKEDPDSPSFDQ